MTTEQREKYRANEFVGGIADLQQVRSNDRVPDYVVYNDDGTYTAVGREDIAATDTSDAGRVIQACYDDGGSNTRVEIAPGKYQATTNITIPGNSSLVGAGRRKTQLQYDSNPGIVAIDFGGGSSSSEQTVRDIALVESGGATVTGIKTEGTTQTVENVWFGALDTGLKTVGSAGGRFIDIQDDGSVRGFEVADSTRNSTFIGCVAFGNKWGLRVERLNSGLPQELSFIGCRFESQNVFGAQVGAGRSISFVGCVFRDNGAEGFLSYEGANVRNVVLSGCLAVDNGTDTSETDATRVGYKIGGDNVILSGCIAEDRAGTQQTGVTLRSDATDPDLRGVSIEDNSTPIVDNGATRPRKDGVIGGGRLGGVDLSATTGQFDGDHARANGSSAAAQNATAIWDASVPEWDYTDPTGSV